MSIDDAIALTRDPIPVARYQELAACEDAGCVLSFIGTTRCTSSDPSGKPVESLQRGMRRR